jgi:hypothetical protein
MMIQSWGVLVFFVFVAQVAFSSLEGLQTHHVIADRFSFGLCYVRDA